MHNNEERFSRRLVPVSILEGRRTRAKREEEKSRREGERKTSVPAVAGADKKS